MKDIFGQGTETALEQLSRLLSTGFRRTSNKVSLTSTFLFCLEKLDTNPTLPAAEIGNEACSGGAPEQEAPLEIRVISSLTLDDEARYAATFLKMLAAVLDSVPTSYAIQVQLADGVVVQHGSALTPPRAGGTTSRCSARDSSAATSAIISS